MRKTFWILGPIALVATGCFGSSTGGIGGGGANQAATVAGGATAGNTDGAGAVALFNNPVNCAFGPDGNIYVCDFDNGRVRKIDGAGTVSTLVNAPNFDRPFGIAFVGNTLYVQTDANDTGARDATTGTVWSVNTLTGTPTVRIRNIGRPRGMLALPDGRLVLSNLTTHTLQILNTTGAPTLTTLAGTDGVAGYVDGVGTAARFDRPYGMTFAPNGDILVADQNNNRIRRVTLTGVVSTYAGNGTAAYTNGSLLTSSFNHPQDIKADQFGNLFVADNGNRRFRVISGGNVELLAGNGIAGFADGDLSDCEFFGMEGFCVDADGNLIVADGTGGEDLPFNRVRKILIR
jgi:sugar lactone lactonase YvrE